MLQPHGWAAKVLSVGWVAARVALWPIFLLHELLLLPRRFPIDEPASEAETHAATQKAAAALGQPSLRAWAAAAEARLLLPSGIVPLRRFQHSYYRSWLLLYESAAFYTAIGFLEFFGLDALLAAWKPEISWLASAAAGNLSRIPGCQRAVPTSLISSIDADFSLPYHAASFPFSTAAGIAGPAGKQGYGHQHGGNPGGHNSRQHSSGAKTEVPGATRRQHREQVGAAVPAGDGRPAGRKTAGSAIRGLLANGEQPLPVANGRTSSSSISGRQHTKVTLMADSTGSCCGDTTPKSGSGTDSGAGGASSALRRVGDSRLTLQDAHLLCMAAKLVYEEEGRIRQVVSMWGIQLVAFHCSPAHENRASGYVPDLCWLVAASPAAVVVAFRGADPFTQVSRRADVPTAKTARSGMGEVLDGFYRALFSDGGADDSGRGSRCPATGPRSEFQQLHDVLAAHVSGRRPLFLAGHSIGGALAAVFAQGLHARRSPLAGRVAGVCTFGAPRCGDSEWARLFDARFGAAALRFVHGADMVPELPTVFAGYAHAGRFVHIASLGLRRDEDCLLAEVEDPAAVAEAVAAEDRWALPLGLAKLIGGVLWRRESAPRLWARALLLPMPGIADHFPCDYERALRAALSLRQLARS